MSTIDFARSLGKRLLSGTPAYEYARRKFIAYKVGKDRQLFEKRHPNAIYLGPHEGQKDSLRAKGLSSQYGQDEYLLSHFGGKTGFFVDIGCNEPYELSNSYALEQAGWNGIAIDPLASLASKWAARKAKFRNAAISDRAETRDYVEIKQHVGWEHALSGFKEFVRKEDMDQYGFVEYPVECLPLTEIVPDDQSVDVIMIDVEGAEMLVLKGIDFDKLTPAVVMIENDSVLGGSEDVRAHMIGEGYKLVARIGAADDVFVRQQTRAD